MEPRISVVTLGVEDIPRSRQFYEGLGLTASPVSNERIVAFQMKGIVFCLYPRDMLAEDATVDPKGSGFRGITLAYNVSSREEVTTTLEGAVKAGATLVKPAQDAFWGGYSGYFSDPDGHLWEVVWCPEWTLDENGQLQLPTTDS